MGKSIGMLGILALATACGLFTSPEERLDLTLELSADRFVRGEPITIAVRAFNRTSDVLEFQTGGCPLTFEILDSEGNVAAPEGFFCDDVLVRWGLLPGDSLTADFRWIGNRWRNWHVRGSAPPEWLPPGRYVVRGILHTADHVERSRSVEVTLQTP